MKNKTKSPGDWHSRLSYEDCRMGVMGMIDELDTEADKIYVLAWSAQEMVHNKDGENEVLKLLDVIQDHVIETTEKLRTLEKYFPEEVSHEK